MGQATRCHGRRGDPSPRTTLCSLAGVRGRCRTGRCGLPPHLVATMTASTTTPLADWLTDASGDAKWRGEAQQLCNHLHLGQWELARAFMPRIAAGAPQLLLSLLNALIANPSLARCVGSKSVPSEARLAWLCASEHRRLFPVRCTRSAPGLRPGKRVVDGEVAVDPPGKAPRRPLSPCDHQRRSRRSILTCAHHHTGTPCVPCLG